ncbi:phosphate uptake regulator PhoU [Candidatus Woesearchaeota archaeon]|nr:phosphate uptake regulator PhoU [Candidatus Woesearchaeota archaeon]
MDYRKIIEFGKSSYVVSLPKSWMTEKKLGKGDVVYVGREGDNLVLYPVENKEAFEPLRVTIDVTDMTRDEIRLHLISKYIRNFNEITLVADNMQSKAKDIRAIIHDLMALEVIEETASKIVTKDFIHMEEISPIELVKKMDMITREMLQDSKNSFNDDRHANIADRDYDVNRLSYLVYRTVKNYQNNPLVAKKKGLKHDDLMSFWVAAVKIEGIADDAKRLAKLIRRLKFKKQEQDQFFKLYSLVEKYYIDSLTVFYEKDSEKAFKLIPQKKKLIKQCRDFYRQNWNHEWVPVILEKLKSIIANSKSLLTYVCDRN